MKGNVNSKASGKKHDLQKALFHSTFFSMAVNELSLTVAIVVDGFCVSHYLGHDAMGGLGLFGTLTTFLALLGGILSSGTQSICGAKLAKADIKGAKSVFNLVFILSSVAGILIMTLALLYSEQLVYLLGGRKDMGGVWDQAGNYLKGFAWGIPPTIINIALVPFLYFDGDQKRASAGIFSLMASDILLDFVAVLVLHGGMFEIGLATSVSHWIEMIIILLHFVKKNVIFCFSTCRPEWESLLQIFRAGQPIIVKRGMNIFRKLALNLMIGAVASGYGLAALNVQSNIKDFADALGIGIGSALVMLTSISINEKNRKEISRLFSIGIDALKYTVLLAAVLLVAAPGIARVYSSDTVVISYITFAIVCYAIGIPITSFNTLYTDYLKGSGKIQYANIMVTLQRLIYIVPVAFVLSKIWGIQGIFVAFPLSELLVFLTIILFHQIRQRRIRIKLDDFLLLPEDFGVRPEDQFSAVIYNIDDVVEISEKARVFCLDKGLSHKDAMHIALCIEEVAANTVMHGFKDEKRNSMEIRLLCENGEALTISFRDDCARFDPVSFYEFMKSYAEDVTRHIGMRVIFGLAKDVKYVNTLQINMLTITI